MKGRLRLFVGIAISLICFYFALRAVDLRLLWQTYRGANYLYLAPALLLIVVNNWARAYRWRLLMYPHDHLPLGRLFSVVNIGYLFNNILPAKVGEVVRGYLVGRMLPGGIAQGLPTLLVERLLDVLTLVALLVGLLPLVALPAWATRAGLVFGLASVGGASGLIVLARFGERGVGWAWGFLGPLPWVGHPKVKTALRNVLLGFRVLTVGRLLPGIVFWSFLIWVGYALFTYVIMAAFHMTYLPLIAAAVVLCATGFSMVIPSSPGAFGPYEGAAVLALAIFGVAETQAFGYAFGLHAFTNVVLILLGFWGLRGESLTFGGIRSEALAQAAPPEAAEDSD